MTRFTALLLPLLICTATAQAAELTASVDRSRLNSGETVELTLETNDVTQFGKPDLTPLEALFEVRGTRQVNQLNTLNGDNRATTRWIITLLPKENGSVVIPPLQLGDVAGFEGEFDRLAGVQATAIHAGRQLGRLGGGRAEQQGQQESGETGHRVFS